MIDCYYFPTPDTCQNLDDTPGKISDTARKVLYTQTREQMRDNRARLKS